MIWLCNAVIELGWVAAAAYLIVDGHSGWGAAFFVAALISGYSSTTTTKGQDK